MSDILRRIARVALDRNAGFTGLVGLAELDPGIAFRGAVMRGDLSYQDLGGFDFTGATFAASCDLRGADLTYTKGITPEMLAGAIHDDSTIRPLDWFWAKGRVPGWVEDWGRDEYGTWATFRVPGTAVTQRMRWCLEGSFMMGTDKDDPASWGDEHPRHRVTLRDGFWMFDTACTEAMWGAVMGVPSETRRGPDFPVTAVSWAQVQDFIIKLNDRVPGLALSLPSEARWEYACRAGTKTPYSFGETVTTAQVRFGEGLKAGPVPVATLPPNPFGLYEMHGNVWEWCADVYANTYDGAPTDGSARPPSDGAASRVIRGGSWNDGARFVRSAVRLPNAPSDRDSRVGFRCARVHSESE